jgi:hypothetical protein
VRVSGREKEATQLLELNSPRIAPYTFFTRNRYLQDFPPQLPEHDLAQLEMDTLQYRPMLDQEEFFREAQEHREEI